MKAPTTKCDLEQEFKSPDKPDDDGQWTPDAKLKLSKESGWRDAGLRRVRERGVINKRLRALDTRGA